MKGNTKNFEEHKEGGTSNRREMEIQFPKDGSFDDDDIDQEGPSQQTEKFGMTMPLKTDVPKQHLTDPT